MLILTLRTDKPEADLGLYEDHRQLAYKTWEAHRQLAETIHSEIKSLLESQGKDWHNIEGIVAFRGPGSFTGLRIGLSVANALAASLPAAIVSSQGKDWLSAGIDNLLSGADEKIALPEYGAPAHITQPKK